MNTRLAAPDGAIDIHAHMVPACFRDAVQAAGLGATLSTGFPAWSPELALTTMDRHHIQTAILSVSQPGVHFGDDAAASRLARQCNELAAGWIRTYPGRFGAFATLPMPAVDAACHEAQHALEQLQLDGVCLLASYGSQYLGDPEFEPLMALLNRHKAVVFVHPNFHPASRGIGTGLPPLMAEFPFDTTRAAMQLIHRRHWQRFPDIRFILAHGGGTLPFLAWRMEMAAAMDPARVDLSVDEILLAVRHFWYDTALASGTVPMRAMESVGHPERLLFGSDWPYGPEPVVAASLKALSDNPAISPTQRANLLAHNACRLFPRLAV